jgi:nickel-dependent lactate racemase
MPAYPRFFRVRQKFDGPRVDDVAGTVAAELARLRLNERVKPGQTVAITAGSRGIANIAVIIQAAVRYFQKLDARPFIVPAMGSHGGGTAEGQRGILAGYGITEESMGCPIKASMETIIVCQTAEGFPVHFDRHASEADHVLVAGRVKPHTDFIGDVESGLMKMMLIGLGKHEGAKIYHRAILDFSFPQIVRSVAHKVMERCHILAGLAIIENGYDQTAQITAVAADELEVRERELLTLARQWMPKLPFPLVDILLIDELGKNISGSGIDTNVVGRKREYHRAAEDEFPKVKRIAVRGLTEETHGNASGIGLIELCTTRLLEQVDHRITRINCLTSGNVAACMLPVNFDTDREIIDAALPTIGLTEPPDAKILWIHNTLDLAEVECSRSI